MSWKRLLRFEQALDRPMLFLGLLWLILMIVELIWDLTPALNILIQAIWVIFVLNFLIEFTIAPKKTLYLRKNWLTLLAIAVPALRVFRLLRIARLARLARAGRGFRLFRVVTSFNRGMKALQQTLGKRGFTYVLALTLAVNLLGAAGMLAFEKDVSDAHGIRSFGEALWWTAMILTTMGSQYWPQTTEGRILALLLATYAFAIFGYITATIASFFVTSDVKQPGSDASADLDSLRVEIVRLREELQKLSPS